MPSFIGANFDRPHTLSHHSEIIPFTQESLSFLQEKLQIDEKSQNKTIKTIRIISLILLPGPIVGLVFGISSVSIVLILISAILIAFLLVCLRPATEIVGEKEPHYSTLKANINNGVQANSFDIRLNGDNKDWVYIRNCLNAYEKEKAEKIEAEKKARKEAINILKDKSRAEEPWSIVNGYLQEFIDN